MNPVGVSPENTIVEKGRYKTEMYFKSIYGPLNIIISTGLNMSEAKSSKIDTLRKLAWSITPLLDAFKDDKLSKVISIRRVFYLTLLASPLRSLSILILSNLRMEAKKLTLRDQGFLLYL